MKKTARTTHLVLIALGASLASLTPLSAQAQSLSPTNADVPPAGESLSVTVTASGDWTAKSDDDWIQVTSPVDGTGTGSGIVTLAVAPDTSTDLNHSLRLGTVTIAGKVFTVTQHPDGQVSYESWSAQLPANVSDPDQDADGDGILNAVEYAFGLNPLQPDNGGLPSLSLQDGVPTLSLTKPKSVVGVRYTVRARAELGSAAAETLTLTKVSETADTETWQAPLPADGATQFAVSTLVQVGVTGREVQQLLADKFNTADRTLALWGIQPGLGTVMIEYGRRIALLRLAVDAGDWGMAQYQLKEATEIQEVGETTRPANASLLKGFEQSLLDPLATDILAKDKASFDDHFTQAIESCNSCHQATGHPYVVFQPPTTSPQDFLMLAASDPQTPGSHSLTPTPPAPGTPLAWTEVQQMVDDAFNTVDRNLALWGIQPGLGTVMMEYGRRIAVLKHAVDAGDWGMAQYQLKEATEIQEVGETTRPANAGLLKGFEQGFLAPLMEDILAKDTVSFNTHFSDALGGCNACHVVTGHPYERVQMPPTSPEPFLKLAASEPVLPAAKAAASPASVTQSSFPAGAPTLAGAETLITNQLNTLDRNLTLWNIQPGLGTVMQEYGYRFTLAWFAEQAENWGMAEYQIKEATEIQEVGEITRPANAALLKLFEQNYLDPINAAIAAKDKSQFESAYQDAIVGCNGCHQATGHSYVRFQLSPVTPADFLNLPAGQ